MRTFTRNSLLMAAVVAVVALNLPQANAQSCQTGGGYYRAYRPVVHQQLLVQPQVVAPVDPGMQLIDLRLVDPGLPGQAGPKIRIVFQNASPVAVSAPFDVVLAAAIDDKFAPTLPIAGQRVTEIVPGQTAVVDLRLPPQSLEMGAPAAPFQNLLVMISQAKDLQGNPQLQTLAVLPRVNLRLVDMRIDPAVKPIAPAGAVITLTGEGFGAEPGLVHLDLGSLKLAGEVVNWTPQAVQVRLPALALAQAAPAQVTLIRADKAIAGMALQVTPAAAVVEQGVQVQVQTGVAAAAAPVAGAPAAQGGPQQAGPQQAGLQGPPQGFNPQQAGPQGPVQGGPQQAGPQGPPQGFNPQQQGFNPQQAGPQGPVQGGQGPVQGFGPQQGPVQGFNPQQGAPQQGQGQAGQAQTAPPQQLPGLGLLQGQGPVR